MKSNATIIKPDKNPNANQFQINRENPFFQAVNQNPFVQISTTNKFQINPENPFLRDLIKLEDQVSAPVIDPRFEPTTTNRRKRCTEKQPEIPVNGLLIDEEEEKMKIPTNQPQIKSRRGEEENSQIPVIDFANPQLPDLQDLKKYKIQVLFEDPSGKYPTVVEYEPTPSPNEMRTISPLLQELFDQGITIIKQENGVKISGLEELSSDRITVLTQKNENRFGIDDPGTPEDITENSSSADSLIKLINSPESTQTNDEIVSVQDMKNNNLTFFSTNELEISNYKSDTIPEENVEFNLETQTESILKIPNEIQETEQEIVELESESTKPLVVADVEQNSEDYLKDSSTDRDVLGNSSFVETPEVDLRYIPPKRNLIQVWKKFVHYVSQIRDFLFRNRHKRHLARASTQTPTSVVSNTSTSNLSFGSRSKRARNYNDRLLCVSGKRRRL